jgi:hypothetical protein
MALLLRNNALPKIKHRPSDFEQGRSFTLPAPYGGLNLRDDITALKPNEARVLENFFPGAGQCEMRPGFAKYAIGLGTGEVETLAAFQGYSASKMLAGANGIIYDVTGGTYTDGNDQYTKVLLGFNGADGGTTIVDSNIGGSSHTWTAAGNANTDDAQKKFGLTSLACDGTGDWVTTADHADFTLGTSEFAVDFWLNCSAASGTAERLAGQAASGLAAATGAWYMERHTTDVIRAHVSNGSAWTTVTGTTTITATGWHHAALVRSGNTLKLFIDGEQEGGDVSFSATVNDSANALRVGAAGEETGDPWTGWIDEFRLSVGAARWTTDFTPPTVPHSPTELGSGFSENRWQTALYADRLFFVNGTDNPQVFNGSTLAGIVWSGSGLSADNDLINIALVRNRLWFCEKNSADVWYGAVGQITAASPLTEFSLSQIAGGGFCMAVGSWSRDGGDGADDLTIFVMSTGEILVYQGDPGSTFSLIGKYQAAPPVGRQCLIKVGGELVVITRLGFLPLSAAVGGVALDLARIDPWGKIAPLVASDAELDGSNAGWHGCLHNGVLYVNVPMTDAVLSKQHVLNTRNGAWGGPYTGWNGSSFCSFENELYFGGMDGTVKLVGGPDDDGVDITANANTAFVYPTPAQLTNVYTGIRPKMFAEGTITGLVGVDTDFVIRPLTGSVVNLFNDVSTTPWGSAWGSPWGSAGQGRPLWFSIRGEGKAISVRMRASGSTSDLKWYASDVLFKPGGIR